MKKLCLMFAALLIITGCGDSLFSGMENKNSSEATNFDVAKKLDNGDYNWILNNKDKVNATDYAAAAMGAAGLDPVKLIQTLNDVAAGGSNNDLTAVLTAISIDTTKLDELQTAKDKLTEALKNDPTNSDLKLQLALTSLTSTITSIAQVAGTVGATGVDVTNGITEAEATTLGNAITTHINSGGSLNLDTDGDGVKGGTGDETLTTVVSEDVNNVVNNSDALSGTSDLKEVLNSSMQGTGGLDADGSKTVTSTEISNYLTSVIGQ